MKNILLAILAIVLVIGVSGCASKQQEEGPPVPTGAGSGSVQEAKIDLHAVFDKIQEGQSKSEIVSLLGEPTEKQKISGKELEYWYYEAGTDVLQIAFDPDTVSAKRLY